MTLSSKSLTAFAYQLLTAAKVSHAKAEIVTKSLVAANLRRVDSYGLQLLPFYIDLILMGNIDIHTDGRVVSESEACTIYDAQHVIGHWISSLCCDPPTGLARGQGLGMMAAREYSQCEASSIW